MNRSIIASCLLSVLFFLGTNDRCLAQPQQPASARDDLLSLVPADAGFCLSLQNLRDESDKWARSAWLKAVRATPLGQAIEKAPELHKLVHLDKELQKHLGVDWTRLRDDIFGDAVVLAYWPAPPNRPEQEQGLLLVQARDAGLLKKLVAQFNDANNKDIKRLEKKQYKGVDYVLRVEKNEHFVLVDGNLLAFASKESLVQWIIDRRRGSVNDRGVIAQQVNRAGAERAFAALWINPRAFDAELQQRAALPGPDSQMLQGFLKHWKPLEAVVLSLNDTDDFEIRLAVQADVKKLPASSQKAFTDQTRPAELWNHFPEDALVALAGQIDPAAMIDSIGDFLTPDNRKNVAESLQKLLGNAVGLDLARDVVPNVGPEWGFFLAAPERSKNPPDVVAALAVKPGTRDVKVDQALLQVVNTLAFMAAFSNSENLTIQRVWQDKIEVRYMVGAKVFPEGVRPAWALKDGYLVFASCPEAVLRFRMQKQPARTTVGGEAPVLMVSITELAKLLRARRDQVIDYLTEKNKGLHRDAANQALEDVLRTMDLVNQITFLQGSGNGQVTWTLRVRPRVP